MTKITVKSPGKTGKTSAIKRGKNTQQPKPVGACSGPGCEAGEDMIKHKTLMLCGACYSDQLRWAHRTPEQIRARAKQVTRLNARFTGRLADLKVWNR